MTDKKEARQIVKELRKTADTRFIRDKSRLITGIVCNLDLFINSNTIFVYNSVNNEVNTNELINHAKKCGKTLAFPTVIGDEMLFYRIDNEKDIKEGYMGIKEPIPSKDRLVDCNEGLIIVPGVAFDKKCNRTGYGKGFYDRYLARHRGLIKIGLGFSFQIFDELKTDGYDIPLDYVITEDSIYKSGDN